MTTYETELTKKLKEAEKKKMKRDQMDTHCQRFQEKAETRMTTIKSSGTTAAPKTVTSQRGAASPNPTLLRNAT